MSSVLSKIYLHCCGLVEWIIDKSYLSLFFFRRNVFEIYDSLSEPSVNLMNDIVKGAVNLCAGCYICVGIFGYITFSTTTEIGGKAETNLNITFQLFTNLSRYLGNILTSYPQSFAIDVLKLGFVMSVAVSFPLVIFPCRTSIHSLMFKGVINYFK